MDLTLTDANFDEEVKKSPVPILVDFWASWCGPCRMIAPVLEELSKDYEGKLVIGKLDVDANQQSAIKYGVMSIPTLLIFKGGQPVAQMVGYQDKDSLKKQIDSTLIS